MQNFLYLQILFHFFVITGLIQYRFNSLLLLIFTPNMYESPVLSISSMSPLLIIPLIGYHYNPVYVESPFVYPQELS